MAQFSKDDRYLGCWVVGLIANSQDLWDYTLYTWEGVSSVQSLSHVQLIATPWTAARQASLSITNSRSLLKLMSIQLVMPSNYLILCHPLLLLPSIFPSIRVFSNESALCIRWPKYWSLSLNPSNEYSRLILGLTCLISLMETSNIDPYSFST